MLKASGSRVRRILDLHDKKMGYGSGTEFPSCNLFYSHRETLRPPKSLGWVTNVSPALWLLSGCCVCRHYPLASGNWYCAVPTQYQDCDGMSWHGEGSWFCAKCGSIKSVGPGSGSWLLVLGSHCENVGFVWHCYSMIDQVSDAAAAMISFLKDCSSRTAIDKTAACVTC